MHNLKHQVFILLGLLAIVPLSVYVFATSAFAAVRCETQYGGGETCVRTGQLQIDKKVWDPDGKSFVDNLGFSSHRFNSGDQVTFKLRVTNTGDASVDDIKVTDTLPSFLEPVSGTYSYTISHLDAGASDEHEMVARIVKASSLPQDKSVICDSNTTNAAEAHSTDFSDRDTAQVCVNNNVLGTTTVPKTLPATGPEEVVFLLGSLPVLGIFGKYLTRFKRN